MPTSEPLSVVLQAIWTMVDIRAARGEGMEAASVAALGAALTRAYHDAMALEMRVMEMEAVAADLDLIGFAKSGEIGAIPFDDGRPQIELTPAGYEALSLETFGESSEHVLAGPVAAKDRRGVGPLCGAVVDAGDLFERRRMLHLQQRYAAALDAGDEAEIKAVLADGERYHREAGHTPFGGDAA